MSGDWLLRSTLGRRKKVKERISPQGRKVSTPGRETEEEEVEDEGWERNPINQPIWSGLAYVSYSTSYLRSPVNSALMPHL